MADLNGLKAATTSWGHAAGDALLRRSGEVLTEAVKRPSHAARIGGDEFAILMPGATEADGEALIEDIHRLVGLNNQYYGAPLLSLAIGAATSDENERMKSLMSRADRAMYASKRNYYADELNDRRRQESASAEAVT